MSAELEALIMSPSFAIDPYPAFRRLREEAPIYWSESWNAWLVTRYDDVLEINKDAERFSNAGRVDARLALMPPDALEELAPLRNHFASGVIDSDPPQHTRLRRMILREFTPRVVENLKPRVHSIVDEHIARLKPQGAGDIVNDLAFHLPVTVICEMLGVPSADRGRFKSWAHDITKFYGTDGSTRLEMGRIAQERILEAREWLSWLAAERRTKPGDDLFSALAVATDDGETLSEAELLATCVTLLVAGHETTTSLISVGLLSLFEAPDELNALRSDTELMNQAIEELVRFVSPVQRNGRVARVDIELGGSRIKEGDLLVLLVGAANRDPAQFDDPESLDIRRAARHLGFGMGIHFCIGAALARTEAPIALTAILRDLPGLHLNGEPGWEGASNIRSLASLPVAFDAV